MGWEVIEQWGDNVTRVGPFAGGVAYGNSSNAGNVRVTADRVALIDWDESHVDARDIDLVPPYNAPGLDDVAYDTAAQASAAW
jgi:hypothetical protein